MSAVYELLGTTLSQLAIVMIILCMMHVYVSYKQCIPHQHCSTSCTYSMYICMHVSFLYTGATSDTYVCMHAIHNYVQHSIAHT